MNTPHPSVMYDGAGLDGNGAVERRVAAPIKAALFGNTGMGGEEVESVYGNGRLERLGRTTQLYPVRVTSDNFDRCLPDLEKVQVIFATWGLFPLTDAHLDRMPALRALFYAAGTVKFFARPLLERGITVVNAAAANALPVAEFTLGQILLANKGYWRNVREYGRAEDYLRAFRGRGNYRTTVSLLGAGQIGGRVIELLRPFQLDVLVFDPYLSEEEAARLGVRSASLSQAFARGDVVSNHLANVPATEGLLNGALFSLMRPNTTFINTGRGRTVNEAEMIEVLRGRGDITALLDVTDPEPCPEESPLRTLPNVTITSHIAGSQKEEIGRLSELMLEEFEAWRAGRPLRHAVTMSMLETLA